MARASAIVLSFRINSGGDCMIRKAPESAETPSARANPIFTASTVPIGSPSLFNTTAWVVSFSFIWFTTIDSGVFPEQFSGGFIMVVTGAPDMNTVANSPYPSTFISSAVSEGASGSTIPSIILSSSSLSGMITEISAQTRVSSFLRSNTLLQEMFFPSVTICFRFSSCALSAKIESNPC